MGRCPESDNKSQHDRVPHELIKAGTYKSDTLVFAAFEMQIDLPQTKKIKMTDHIGRCEYNPPSGPETHLHQTLQQGIVEMPYHRRHGLPFPVEEDQHQAGCQNKSAAFDFFWNYLCPLPFECRPRHYGMLNSEKSEQECVRKERLKKSCYGNRVDRFRYEEIAHKPYCANQGEKKDAIAY